MNRKEYILTLFLKNREILRNLGIKSIGIFGSVVRDEEKENSDYDILVEFEKECRKFYNFNQLCDFLENHLGDRFDLVTADGLSPYIGERILKEVEYVHINS